MQERSIMSATQLLTPSIPVAMFIAWMLCRAQAVARQIFILLYHSGRIMSYILPTSRQVIRHTGCENFGDPASRIQQCLDPSELVIYSPVRETTVCLTIFGDSCSSSFCREVLIPDSVNYHQIYGQVFAGNFPLQTGDAMLLEQKFQPK